MVGLPRINDLVPSLFEAVYVLAWEQILAGIGGLREICELTRLADAFSSERFAKFSAEESGGVKLMTLRGDRQVDVAAVSGKQLSRKLVAVPAGIQKVPNDVHVNRQTVR